MGTSLLDGPAVEVDGGGTTPSRADAGGRTEPRSSRRAGVTPLGAIARGAVAAAVGTAAMDALLYVRYRKGGGKSSFAPWEFSVSVSDWGEAPAPAQVGKRLYEGLCRRELGVRYATLVNNITHWGYGILGGVQYGVVAESLSRQRVLYGLPFGASVWTGSYVILPAIGLYKPIWEYDLTTLAKDLSAHLLYGSVTAGTLRLLSPHNGGTSA